MTIHDFLKNALARESDNLEVAIILASEPEAPLDVASHLLRVKARIDLLEELQRSVVTSEKAERSR